MPSSRSSRRWRTASPTERSSITFGRDAPKHSGTLRWNTPRWSATPEILADFRIGLSFDEPEVKEKLAKALEYVALADPSRLRHQVPSLAEHLDDEDKLVRYHPCTTLVAVGSEHPAKLVEAQVALGERLDDENPYDGSCWRSD